MYYHGARNFLVSFLVSLFPSIIVCVVFFFVGPMLKPQGDRIVPEMLGSTPEQARVIAESRGLLLVVGGEEESEEFADNLVCRQAPLPGSVVGNKSTVTIFVSKGSSVIPLPDLTGQSLSEATVKLSELSLKVGEVKSEENSEISKDRIVRTTPQAGTSVKKGDMISVVLSLGVQEIAVPRVIGKSLSSAKRIVEESGFTVGRVSYELSAEFNVGIVMRQRPSAGTTAQKGSAVDLVVATVLE